MNHSHVPELMAPAGEWDAMRAAVANGADAVYFGLSNFSARQRATNFTLAELPNVMRYLHDHNVKGYLTFNTLMFSDELPQAVELIAAMAHATVDAVIVQDLGLAKLISRVAPGLEVHGSTQMTLTEPRGLNFVGRLGIRRVVLARELSMADIGKIAPATTVALEVFVHGALCVAYSGQCLTSESLGGRSANRGQCAQACRLPYQLVVDGEEREMGDKAYLLSPQDLAAHDLIADLVKLGVACFKIEGRLKSAHYVAATTQAYRAAVDAALAGRAFALPPQQKQDLAQSFSRGFTHGFLSGVNHQTLVPALFPKSRGILAGHVVGKTARGIVIAPEGQATLKPGDGVVFDEGHPEQDEQGGRVYEVNAQGKGRSAEVVLGRGSVNLAAIAIGAKVWKTDDPAIRRRLEQSFSRDLVMRRSPVHVHLRAAVGQLLRVEMRDEQGRHAEASWDRPLERAQKHPLTVEVVREQFGRLGDTPYELRSVELAGEAGGEVLAMVPKSVLNDLRRRAVEELLRQRDKRELAIDLGALDKLRADAGCRVGTAHLGEDGGQCPRYETPPHLTVLARTLEQLRAVLAWPGVEQIRPAIVYCDFEDVRRYKEAVELARAAAMPIGLATLRIVKPGEEGLLRQTLDCAPDAILVRNLAALSFYREVAAAMPLLGDYSLNVANELTAKILLDAGLSRLVPSYDLNWKQLVGMVQRMPADCVEVVIHQHMPMFHMEHCVFAATLSKGKDYRDCGRPCDRHALELRDRVGAEHPVVPDVGCRNTVYNTAAQSAAQYVAEMKQLGIRHYRVELLRERPDEVSPLLDQYGGMLAGHGDARAAIRQLKVINQLGVTAGTLDFE